jgi:ATP-dependent helicase HepA
VQGLPDVQIAIVMGLQRAQGESAKRVKQLQLRAARAAGNERAALELEVAFEEAAGQALTAAIETPTLRLDSTGIVIVSGEELTLSDDA